MSSTAVDFARQNYPRFLEELEIAAAHSLDLHIAGT